jgi:peptide chain release factor 3
MNALVSVLVLVLVAHCSTFIIHSHSPLRNVARKWSLIGDISVRTSIIIRASSSRVDDDKEGEAVGEQGRAVFVTCPEEIDRRRNFAIISHPDAGKTTLTEKLLLFGGAIQDAGAVKARRGQKDSTSDYLEIEKQRGISVSSTVLTFEYELHNRKYQCNLLDTPGHADFGEDTFRTLAVSDSCVLLVDAAKGIEDRTRQLFEVTRIRKLPAFTFVNKLDRPSKSPWEIIDELEKEFSVTCIPCTWPIGSGPEFEGVLCLNSNEVHLFEKGNRRKKIDATTVALGSPELVEVIGQELYDQLMEDVDMLQGLIPPLDMAQVKSGQQTPMFFGSAMTNFGVELFLKRFLEYAPKPTSREAMVLDPVTGSPSGEDTIVSPEDDEFSGLIFKLQANLDPRHRDRMAFVRVCSGKFERNMKQVNHSRMKKTINLSTAQNLFGDSRETVEVAFPGDIIGIHNPGHFAIGDTIHTGTRRISFPGIPSFSPEKFSYIRNPNPSTYKKFKKGIDELLQEGAVQMLRDRGDDGAGEMILAAVGQLQFEVVEHRLKHEYGVESKWEAIGYVFCSIYLLYLSA